MTAPKNPNRYTQIIESIFTAFYREGDRKGSFKREDIGGMAERLQIKLPKNIGDILYSFRYRVAIPPSIQRKAPEGEVWIIRSEGRSQYAFVLVDDQPPVPSNTLSETKVPDATPGIVAKYALGDEQALLARLRYNRLVDIFLRVTCYSLQSHLRTTVPNLGQVETDEIYVGIDRRGAHYVIPIQAKGGTDKLNIVQIEQDMALCKHRFPELICRPVGAQFMVDDVIALFEFEETDKGITVAGEKHYRLVQPDDLTSSVLNLYKDRSFSDN